MVLELGLWEGGRDWRDNRRGVLRRKEAREIYEKRESGVRGTKREKMREELRDIEWIGKKRKGDSMEKMRVVGRGYKMGFWNITGIGNKDMDFWEVIKEWDIIFLLETWLDERGWGRIRGKLPTGFKWEVQLAKIKNKKGRAMEGIVVGVRVRIEMEKK